MKKLFSLFLVLCIASSFVFGQKKKVAVVTFYVDKYIDYSKVVADARDYGESNTLADDPNFDLRPLLNDFYETFKKDYVKQFPFELVDEKKVIGNDKYQAYTGLEGVEDNDSLDEYIESMEDRFISIDGYKVLLEGGNMLRSWRTEAHMLNIFDDVDGVMFVYLTFAFEPKIAIGGMGNAGIRAYMHMNLYNKEAKKVFSLEEHVTSKKSVPLINGFPVMNPDKLLPMCFDAAERIIKKMDKELGKLVKKVNKKL